MKILMLGEFLPPDFGAVGQYAVGFARALATEGHFVTLVGFSSTAAATVTEIVGDGQLTVRKMQRPTYDRSNLLARAFWTLGANLALVWGSRREFLAADEIRFTGSPAYIIHFVMPVAKLYGIGTRYRITDFHPECLIAMLGRTTWWLNNILRLTNYWRRRVDVIEVLGEDQRRRIIESGVDPARIELRRDPSPVSFGRCVRRATPPGSLAGRKIILYSGNWGQAHDHETFLQGFGQFCATHGKVAGIWLNATGKRADIVEEALRRRRLPYARTQPVPLSELASVMMAADLHLITLDDRFVGYVLPSKVYACLDSGKPILFIGSAHSDVHMVCTEARAAAGSYRRVDVYNIDGVVQTLTDLLVNESAVVSKLQA
mgnify:CR=1 FL=1